MKFIDRKEKYKKFQKVSATGETLPESFYAAVTDGEVETHGTPLNAKTLNGMLEEIGRKISRLEDIVFNMFDIEEDAVTAGVYDSLNLQASEYEGKNITALQFDMKSKIKLNI